MRRVLFLFLFLSTAVAGCVDGLGGAGGSSAASKPNLDENRPYRSFDSFPASTNILDVVPELQRTARADNHGELGCGAGTITVKTSRGVQTVESGLGPIHVFGQTIDVADVHTLLQSRVDSNRTGKPGPMSKNVDDLCFVSLSTVERAADPQSAPILIALLDDKSENVRKHSSQALRAIAAANPEVQDEVHRALRK